MSSPHIGSSSEEDEDQDHFEKDDFIVDVVDDDDEDSDEEPPVVQPRRLGQDTSLKNGKKRRRYREESLELADRDLQLMNESGVGIQQKKKKLKRLRKGASKNRSNMLDELRELAEEDTEEQVVERRRRADEPVDFDDDMDDFIDDGGRKRRRRGVGHNAHVSSSAGRLARSLFGNVEDTMQYRGSQNFFLHGHIGSGEEEGTHAYGAKTTRRPRANARCEARTLPTERQAKRKTCRPR